MKTYAIAFFVLLSIWIVLAFFKFQYSEYVEAIICVAMALTFVLTGYFGAKMQLEKGKNSSALIVMFVTGYMFCRILERAMNLLF